MVIDQSFDRRGIPAKAIGEIDRRIRLRTSFSLDDMSPVNAARSARTPALVYQVRDDLLTRPEDVQAI